MRLLMKKRQFQTNSAQSICRLCNSKLVKQIKQDDRFWECVKCKQIHEKVIFKI